VTRLADNGPRPFYEDEHVTLYHGDCRKIVPALGGVDLVVTDPPYGETSLGWDRRVDGWLELVDAPQLWCWGSLRSHIATGPAFAASGWRLAQDLVWEKHNGSGFHTDRFKRVHELALHWYRGEWGALYRDVPVTRDARPKVVRRKERPTHMGAIENSTYVSEDGGPRLMRSVLQVRSEHGRAVHPTQKPLGVLRPLVHCSCPPGGVVLDPFAGSGSTLLAARELGRRAIGIEIDESYCRAAAQRLAQGGLLDGEVA